MPKPSEQVAAPALTTIGEIFTPEEVERARRLYEECPAGTFAARCAAEVVTPALSRINGKLGQEKVVSQFEFVPSRRA